MTAPQVVINLTSDDEDTLASLTDPQDRTDFLLAKVSAQMNDPIQAAVSRDDILAMLSVDDQTALIALTDGLTQRAITITRNPMAPVKKQLPLTTPAVKVLP